MSDYAWADDVHSLVDALRDPSSADPLIGLYNESVELRNNEDKLTDLQRRRLEFLDALFDVLEVFLDGETE